MPRWAKSSARERLKYFTIASVVAVVFVELKTNIRTQADTQNITQDIKKNVAPDNAQVFSAPTKDKDSKQSEYKQRQHLKEFIKEGWELVTAEEPDEKLLSLDLSELAQNEERYSEYLLSNSFSDKTLESVAQVARHAKEDRTIYAAIDALGRSTDTKAQALLLGLYQSQSLIQSRSQILPLIRPEHIGDENYEFLLGIIQSHHESNEQKEQAAFTLVLAHLRNVNGKATLANLYSRIGEPWKTKVKNIQTLAEGGKIQ